MYLITLSNDDRQVSHHFSHNNHNLILELHTSFEAHVILENVHFLCYSRWLPLKTCIWLYPGRFRLLPCRFKFVSSTEVSYQDLSLSLSLFLHPPILDNLKKPVRSTTALFCHSLVCDTVKTCTVPYSPLFRISQLLHCSWQLHTHAASIVDKLKSKQLLL